MKGMEIKQNIQNFQDLKKDVHSKACVSKTKEHYRKPILVLNVSVYIFEVKKGM